MFPMAILVRAQLNTNRVTVLKNYKSYKH